MLLVEWLVGWLEVEVEMHKAWAVEQDWVEDRVQEESEMVQAALLED